MFVLETCYNFLGKVYLVSFRNMFHTECIYNCKARLFVKIVIKIEIDFF